MSAPVRVIAPTIVRFSFYGLIAATKPWTVVQDISIDEGSGENRLDEINNFAPHLLDIWLATVMQAAPVGLHVDGMKWQDLDSLTGQSGLVPIGGRNGYGFENGALSPPNVALLIKKSCAHSRAQRTGKSFMPGVLESDVDDVGNVNGTRVGAITTKWEAFRTQVRDFEFGDPTGTTFACRVVHVLSHSGISEPGWPNGKPTAWESTDVVNFACDTRVSTQRRRLRR